MARKPNYAAQRNARARAKAAKKEAKRKAKLAARAAKTEATQPEEGVGSEEGTDSDEEE